MGSGRAPAAGAASGLAVHLSTLGLVGLLTYGSRGSLGLFVRPWEEAFDASRASVSLVAAFGFVALGLGQPLAGRLLESFPARTILVAGLSLSALGFGVGAFSGALWITLAAVGVVGAFGAGLASLPTLSFLGAALVPRRTGLVFGLLTAAAAGGQVVVLPVAAAALGISLRAALLTLAALLAAAALAVLALLPGVSPAPRAEAAAGGRLRRLAGARGFWCLLVPFFVCGYTTTGLVDTHLIPHALDHRVGEATAAGALATLAAFNVGGVLVAGAVTDRVDRGRLLAVIYVARAATLVALPFLTSPAGLFAFAVLFGLADFASVPPTTSLTRSLFERGGWGLALGLVSGAHQAGSALGAYLGGRLFDASGTYLYSFWTAAAALLLAAALSYGLRERGRDAPEPATA